MRSASRRPVAHRWERLADLTEAEIAQSDPELPALASRWDERRRSLPSALLREFNDRLIREWSIETGIIERIYVFDRKVTRALIEKGIKAELIPKEASELSPQQVTGIIRDHEAAVEWLLSSVKDGRRLSTAFVKELHALMTRGQPHYEAFDQFGRRVKAKLNHGTYKTLPNNPIEPDGSLHEYCPPEQVSVEMDRLVSMHLSHEGVPPDVEAAWLHHRFAQIHPFQDGNGRVSRALASLALIRAGLFPLLVTDAERDAYLATLNAADQGNLSELTSFIAQAQKRLLAAALNL